MRCVVLGMRNAVRCEIWCYGDMARASSAGIRTSILLYLIVLWSSSSLSLSSFVIPKKSSQLCSLLLARARAACRNFGFANAIRICVLELQMRCLGILELQMYFCFLNTDTVRSI